MKKTCLWINVCIFVLLGSAAALAQPAEQLMRQVIDREDGKTQINRITLTTYRYVKQQGKIVQAEMPRIKVMEGVSKDAGPDGKDEKMITIIREPAGEKGIGFLQYDYAQPGRETDQWMYFSALGKVKRIVSGSENEPKTGSFFGSELTYEDLEERRLQDYTYTQLAEETYQGRPCLVIESVPTAARARQSNYSKLWSWVDRERYLVLKTMLFDRQGNRVKRIVGRDVEKINGIWVIRTLIVFNLQSRRLTEVHFDSIALNVAVDDTFLTQRSLTDGAFREGQLKKIRGQIR